MGRLLVLVSVLTGGVYVWAGEQRPTALVTGLRNPQSVAVGADGQTYVSEGGEPGKDGEGRILVRDKAGKSVPFATGLDDPRGLVFWQKWLFVTDPKRIWRIDEKGRAVIFAAQEAFPTAPHSLQAIAVDENGILYVSDAGDQKGHGGSVYRIDSRGRVRGIADTRSIPALKTPSGVVLDGMSHLLLLDSATGELLRVRIADGTAVKVSDGLEGGHGLVWDWFGQLFIASSTQGTVWGIPRPGHQPVRVASGFQAAAHPCLDTTGTHLLVPDRKAGTLTALPTTIPGHEVDATPLPLKGVSAFPKLKWAGWEGFTEQGKVVALRPVFLTHAGDGSRRNFVTLQQGTIHVFPNDPEARQTKIFLDIQKKVFYADQENEQGLLGLAFHPNYKKNGEFFVFYSLRQLRLTNVISRFRVSKDDPDRADPESEEELLGCRNSSW
jgi:sugar lactone lactonase YvrE